MYLAFIYLSIWDAATGAEIHTLKGHSDDVTSVAYSPDGSRIVTGSSDNTAKIWNATDGSLLLDVPLLPPYTAVGSLVAAILSMLSPTVPTHSPPVCPPTHTAYDVLRKATAVLHSSPRPNDSTSADPGSALHRLLDGADTTAVPLSQYAAVAAEQQAALDRSTAALRQLEASMAPWSELRSGLQQLPSLQRDDVTVRDSTRRQLLQTWRGLQQPQPSMLTAAAHADPNAAMAPPPPLAASAYDAVAVVKAEVARRVAALSDAVAATKALVVDFTDHTVALGPDFDPRLEQQLQHLTAATEACTDEGMKEWIRTTVVPEAMGRLEALKGARNTVDTELTLKTTALAELRTAVDTAMKDDVVEAIENTAGITDTAAAAAKLKAIKDATVAVRRATVQLKQLDLNEEQATLDQDDAELTTIDRQRTEATKAHRDARSKLVALHRPASRIIPRYYPEHLPELQTVGGSTDAALRGAPYTIGDFTMPEGSASHPGGVVEARLKAAASDDERICLKRFDDFAKFEREVKALLRGEGPHVAPVLYTFEDKERWYLATPWYGGGTIDAWTHALWRAHNSDGGSTSSVLGVALRMLSQVTAAYARLHAQGIAHGDVKPANVVVGGHIDGDAADAVRAAERCEPYLIDFGIAIPLEGKLDLLYQTLSATMVGGTLKYLAPEVTDALERHTVNGLDFRATDAYSLGQLIKDVLKAAVGNTTTATYSDGWVDTVMPVPSDGGAARRTVATLLQQLSSATPTDRPTLAQAHAVLQKAAEAEDVLECSVCCSPFRRSMCAWSHGGGHVYCTDPCLSNMVQTSWVTGVPLSTHEARGSVFVTCEAFPGCGGRLHGEGMRRLRPAAQTAVDMVKANIEVERARRAEAQRLQGQGTTITVSHIEEKVSSLFIPNCPWCGVAGTFEFEECMAITCGSQKCLKPYCGYCLAKGNLHDDAGNHNHVTTVHATIFAGITAPHSTNCIAHVPDPDRPGEFHNLEPLWTCEPRWRVAWYRTQGLEARAVALYSLVVSVNDRKASWQRLLGDVAPFPASLQH